MSGRVATPAPNRRTTGIAKVFLALGLFAGTSAVLARQAAPDDKPPLPPSEPKRTAVAQKYQIKDKGRAIFKGHTDVKGNLIPNTGIVDFAPFVLEKNNADEYQAWHEVTRHAGEFTAAELEAYAGRDLIRDDLIKPALSPHRLELLRFDGKLTKLRRVAATQTLREAGIAEVYEALIVPLSEPSTEPMSVVFTELPESLAAVKEKPEGQWMAADEWVSAAGYFFKVKQDGPKADAIPVLIGKSVTVLKGPPAGPDKKNLAALDKNLRVFKYIRDNAPMARGEENWEEASAWNRVLLHARRFSPEELEENARADLDFADLFKDVRRDYKLELVKIEGRLIKLRKMEPSQKLRDAGIETAYEGWIVPKDEPRGNPISVVFTDRPDGVEPSGRVNAWVTFAGYSFKLLQYESGERDKNDPKKNVWKKAPLLLGRAIIVRPDPESSSSVSWQSFATVATAVVLGLIGISLALSWWFRRGDKRAKQELNTHRANNPFGETSQ